MVTVLRKSTSPPLVAGFLALASAPGAAPKGDAQLVAPAVTFGCTPAPADCTGWYTTPVTVRWTWDATATKTVGCNTDTITWDTQGEARSCYAENQCGQSTRVEIKIKVDRTPPTVTAAVPDRPPDANGWYHHPLSMTFQGVDATSGVAACSVPAYAGPDSGAASVAGTCRDNAGNTSPAQPYGFKYDATTPTIHASSSELNETVVLRWTASSNTKSVSIHRAPAFANLFSPARNALLRRPPLLRLAPVRGATDYNVQLRRNGKKILSVWPVGTSLQLHWRWRFQHRRYRLSPGCYVWYVWPGLGDPAAVRFGQLLGHSGFTLEG
jgi:hypothetical protein